MSNTASNLSPTFENHHSTDSYPSHTEISGLHTTASNYDFYGQSSSLYKIPNKGYIGESSKSMELLTEGSGKKEKMTAYPYPLQGQSSVEYLFGFSPIDIAGGYDFTK